MNILIWHPIYVLGGGLQILLNLAKHIAQNDQINSVHAVISANYDKSVLSYLQSYGITVQLVRTTKFISYYAEKSDVIYVIWPHGIRDFHFSKPSVCIYQDTIWADSYGAHSTSVFIQSMDSHLHDVCNGYSRIIVTSEYTKKRISELVKGQFDHKIIVIPHVATEAFEVLGGNFALPNHLEPQNYLFYPANVAEHKNHLALVKALVLRKSKKIKLVCCGYGTEQLADAALSQNPYINILKKYISDNDLLSSGDLIALGYLNDQHVQYLLDNALGLIMPTRAEGMGLPVHEAINKKLPVIASSIPVFKEHFEHRSQSILWIDPDSPNSIAIAWDHLCAERDHFFQLAKLNLDSNCNWEDICERTILLFREAAKSFCPTAPPSEKFKPLSSFCSVKTYVKKAVKKCLMCLGLSGY